MESSISNEISNDSTLFPLVQEANEILKTVFGRAKEPPRVDWRIVPHEPMKPAVELQLSDQTDSVRREFTLNELQDPRELRFILSSLWGDLIISAFNGSSERLLLALRELRKEEESRELQLQGA
jgi:hypothetical protein